MFDSNYFRGNFFVVDLLIWFSKCVFYQPIFNTLELKRDKSIEYNALRKYNALA